MDDADLDRLVAELGAVQDELLATPADDFARRYELGKRQDELREQVAAFDPDAGRSRAELEAEMAEAGYQPVPCRVATEGLRVERCEA